MQTLFTASEDDFVQVDRQEAEPREVTVGWGEDSSILDPGGVEQAQAAFEFQTILGEDDRASSNSPPGKQQDGSLGSGSAFDPCRSLEE
ncbi:hypothetical protein WJX84_004828 [Apatococcus fuscideae]|uniref:Uncharacterized protein n=1 Tax=Apatococcus fuscideae TaxID=2026836 RepID=A0AAW1TES7_9CHLO